MSGRRRPSDYYEEEDIYERDDRYPNGGRREQYFEEDIDYRHRRPGKVVREVDERIRVRDRSVPDLSRTRTKDDGAVVREREWEDIEFRSRDRPKEIAKESQEILIRRGPPPREERPRRKDDREEIIIRERDRDRDGRSAELDEIEFKKRERSLPPRQEKIVWEEEERSRRRPSKRDVERDEVVIRRRDRSLPAREEYDRDEVVVRRRDKSVPAREDYERDEVVVRKGRKGRRSPVSDDEREEVVFRRPKRDRSREREWERDEFRRYSSPPARSQSRYRSDAKEEIVLRRDEREGRHGRGDIEREEVIIRKREERSPSTESQASSEPRVIRAPPIHQEVITHHRHIDHGYEAVPLPRARSPEVRSRSGSFDEIEIRQRGERRGRSYEDDLIIDRRKKEKEESPPPRRRRSPEPAKAEEVIISRTTSRPEERERERDLVIRERERERRSMLDEHEVWETKEEVEYSAPRKSERRFLDEAHKGSTKDWTVVDVPPGTKRIIMDGVGGGNEEITRERRRSKVVEGDEFPSDRTERRRRARPWTELTKDLVVREAIERAGYEYEETERFYHVFDYLKYDDVAMLVDLSDRIRRSRSDRIHEVRRERIVRESLPAIPAPPLPPAAPRAPPPRMLERTPDPYPWEEERIRERDVIIEEGRRPSRRR